MAEYLPEEEDPSYTQHVTSIGAYREQVENTYPPVCENCIGRVREQVRASGYTAKADHLRRILQTSRANREGQQFRARRLYWTHVLLVLTKYIYVFNLTIAVLWHMTGSVVREGDIQGFSWRNCSKDVLSLMTQKSSNVESECFKSKSVLIWVKWGLLFDLVTLWWNPKISDMIYRPFGRMHGLWQLWLARLFVFGLRLLSLLYLTDIPEDREARLSFQHRHMLMLAFIVISALITWTSIRIESTSRVTAFSKPVESYLPTATSLSGSGSQEQHQPVRPGSNTFDSMAQAFTTSFNAPGSSQDVQLPPTPSSIASSGSLSESETPYRRKSVTQPPEGDSMDWTPTRQDRFGRSRITVQPPLFSQPTTQSRPSPRSILSANKPRDTNPFHQRIPAMPRGPTAQKQDPWNQGIWNPALQENKNRFLDNIMKQGQSPETRDRMENGVPRTVRRDAELFQEPKFKYDYTGLVNQKTTGLEEVFNNLFQT